LSITAPSQDTTYTRPAGATWADAYRGPAGEPPAAVRNPGDPRVRIRLFIAGRLADEAWLDTADPDAARLAAITTAVHAEGAAAAREYGLPWLIEVYQPAEPPEVAYLRTGSDRAAMADPVALTVVNGAVG
jgi:hypothetical protein